MTTHSPAVEALARAILDADPHAFVGAHHDAANQTERALRVATHLVSLGYEKRPAESVEHTLENQSPGVVPSPVIPLVASLPAGTQAATPQGIAHAALEAAPDGAYAIAISVDNDAVFTKRKVYWKSGKDWVPMEPDLDLREPRAVASGAVVNDTIGFRQVQEDSYLLGGIVRVVVPDDAHEITDTSWFLRAPAEGVILLLTNWRGLGDDVAAMARRDGSFELMSADDDVDGTVISAAELCDGSEAVFLLHDPAVETLIPLITEPFIRES